jgi:YsiA-like protein, C-terminal region./Bacterial regulatory proteins, tetR family.
LSLSERKIAKKREDILRSAVKILAEKGFHGTTMEEIAARLLMTKGTPYYFRDKQDLVFQAQVMLLERSLGLVGAIVGEKVTAEEKLKRAIIAHILSMIEKRSVLSPGFKPEQVFDGTRLNGIYELRKKYTEGFDRIIGEGMAAGEFSRLDVKIVRNLLLGAMNWVVTGTPREENWGRKSRRSQSPAID